MVIGLLAFNIWEKIIVFLKIAVWKGGQVSIASFLGIADKELDIIEMAVYGDVIRPGNECRCRTVAEMLGKYKSKDSKAACKLPPP